MLGNYYDKQAKELAAIAEVVKGDNGIQVFLKNDILFQTGSSELSADAMQTLTDLNRVLKKYPKNRIVVQGYTDSTGSDAINNKLSKARAKAVYDFLLGSNLRTKSISYVGYGSSNPIASNRTAAGRAANRRVVLAITANEKDLQSFFISSILKNPRFTRGFFMITALYALRQQIAEPFFQGSPHTFAYFVPNGVLGYTIGLPAFSGAVKIQIHAQKSASGFSPFYRRRIY